MTKEYNLLFNAMSDSVLKLEEILNALQEAQKQAEEAYVRRTESIRQI